MGADFLLYCCEEPTDYKKAMPLIEYRINNLSDDDLDGIAEDILWYDANEIEEESGLGEMGCGLKEEDLWKINDLTSIKVRSMVREKIRAAANELFSNDICRRDVTSMHLHGRTYLMTGGMSWGDLPTEACEIMNLIDHCGITEGMGQSDFDYESFKT